MSPGLIFENDNLSNKGILFQCQLTFRKTLPFFFRVLYERKAAPFEILALKLYSFTVKSAFLTQMHFFVSVSAFCNMKRQVLLPLGGMLVHRRATPGPGTHLYTWVKRGTMKVRCLAQEHNTMPRTGLQPGQLDPESSALTITGGQ